MNKELEGRQHEVTFKDTSSEAATEHKYLNGMITLQEFNNLILAHKKTSKIACDLKSIKKWLTTIDKINSLDRFVSNIDGIPIEQFTIPKVFKDLIMPSSVTISGKTFECDFRKRYIYDFKEAFTNNHDFNVISNALASALYKDTTQTEAVTRPDSLVTDLEGRLAYDGCVMASLIPFIPVELDTKFFNDNLYNEDAKTVFKDALREKLQTVKS